ncbi:MAG: winged helix-turn-helix domain-containing protein [Nitrospirota bacterium]
MRALVPDPQTIRVAFRTQSVFLTPIEFRLLKQLLASDGGFLNRQNFLSYICGPQVSVEGRTVDSTIIRLRQKLQGSGDQSPTIETLRGVGYRINIIDDFSVPS